MDEGPVLSPETIENGKTNYVEVLGGNVRVQIAVGTSHAEATRSLRQVAEALGDSTTYTRVVG